MRRKQIAVIGMLFMTCLASTGCGQKKEKQESSIKGRLLL